MGPRRVRPGCPTVTKYRPLTIVVTAGPGEESCARQVAKDIDGNGHPVGLTIPELAELIRGARLYIGKRLGRCIWLRLSTHPLLQSGFFELSPLAALEGGTPRRPESV